MLFNESVTPLQHLTDPLLSEKKVSLLIKRDDLIHPHISGNKWRKLKYNLIEAKKEKKKVLLTFGGAFSNYIYAVANAGREFSFKTIGIIRGEKTSPLNKVLSFAVKCGMDLHYISREAYRQKEERLFIRNLYDQFGDFYLLPEGGTNTHAVKGASEVVKEIDIPFNFLSCACGTGGTLAGLIAGAKGKNSVIGFPVLKGIHDMEGKIKTLVKEYSGYTYDNWILNDNYHFGGYAKANKILLSFIADFKNNHDIDLDTVYMGKMMFGIYDLIQKDYFKPNSTIIVLHTGGLH